MHMKRTIASKRVFNLLEPSFFSMCLVLLVILTHCVEDDIVPAEKAQQRVSASYEARRADCKTQSGVLLLVPHDVKNSDVIACESALLTARCPILEAPPLCLYLLVAPAPKDLDGI